MKLSAGLLICSEGRITLSFSWHRNDQFKINFSQTHQLCVWYCYTQLLCFRFDIVKANQKQLQEKPFLDTDLI